MQKSVQRIIRSRRRSIRNEGITIQGISCTVIIKRRRIRSLGITIRKG